MNVNKQRLKKIMDALVNQLIIHPVERDLRKRALSTFIRRLGRAKNHNIEISHILL